MTKNGDLAVQTKKHCIAEGDVLLFIKWANVFGDIKNDADETAVDGDDVSAINLVLATETVVSPPRARSCNRYYMRERLTYESVRRKNYWNENVQEEFPTTEQTLGRSVRVGRAHHRFENFASVAVEDPMTLKKAMKSWDKELRLSAMKEKLKSIESYQT